MMKRVLKWFGIVFAAAGIVGIVYLAVQPDPGPYFVALRSDTPDQVSKALDALEGDTSFYNGSYPPFTDDDLRALGRRYLRKARGQNNEPLIGDTAAWIGFANRVAAIIQTRQKKP